MQSKMVSSRSQLLDALGSGKPGLISVDGSIDGLSSLALAPGQSLAGARSGACLSFARGQDGLILSMNNQVRGLTLLASPERRAVFNSPAYMDLGEIELSDLLIEGQVQLIARQSFQQGSISLSNIYIRKADSRDRDETVFVSGNGVHVMQGALTIWNQQVEGSTPLTAAIRNVRIGSPEAPVLGGGVFLSGSVAKDGGKLELGSVEIHSVYADSGLPSGTSDRVAAAVFVLPNAIAREVHSAREIETFGANCVALDNWGEVDDWIADADVRSHGPNAIAIVNAGRLGSLRVAGRVETFGQGARGMSIYADTGSVQLHSLTTHGDAASGLHVTRSVKRFRVMAGITTHGGSGESLVKGKLTRMRADGIDVAEGGAIAELEVHGSITVHGADGRGFSNRDAMESARATDI